MSVRQQLSSAERVLADHDILAQYIDNFNKLSASDSATDHQQAADTVRAIINQWLVAHFAYEEQRLFPEILDAQPSIKVYRLIASLKIEHKSLLDDAKRLNQLLKRPDRPGAQRDELRKAMLDFITRLQQHSASENELFPSLI